jgi:hypothetical protein
VLNFIMPDLSIFNSPAPYHIITYVLAILLATL